MRQKSPAHAESILPYARPDPNALSAWRAIPVRLAVAAIVAELGAFTSVALGYNGPLPMNWFLFNTLVMAGLNLSALGFVFGIREFRRGDRRNALMLAGASSSVTLLLAGGFYVMMFVFGHF